MVGTGWREGAPRTREKESILGALNTDAAEVGWGWILFYLQLKKS
jgi:hypothetical protein